MFDTDLEKTIIYTAIVFWFANGWYMNEKLKDVHKKLDRTLQAFDGLREYLYEIDPQFDDERESYLAFQNDESIFAGFNDSKLIQSKKQNGKRTLNTSFIES